MSSAFTVRVNTTPAISGTGRRLVAEYGHRYNVDFYVIWELDGELHSGIFSNAHTSIRLQMAEKGVADDGWLAEKL